MWPLRILFFLGVFATAFTVSSGELSDVTELLQLGGEVLAKIFHTWEVVSPERERDGPGEYLGPEVIFCVFEPLSVVFHHVCFLP